MLSRSFKLYQRSTVLRSSYSSSSLMRSGEHAPPKKTIGITGRYASALYTAASKGGVLDKVETELLAVGNVISKNQGFKEFLNNPTISRQDKLNKVGALIDEKKFTHFTRNLFLTLSANGRIGEANKVIAAYEELMQESRGAMKVTIISATELQKKQLETVKAGALSLVPKGASVEVTTQVDPSILGGLQVMIGDKFLDLSVSSRVAELSTQLEQAAN
mmetsp:Transcript_38997/g.107373  ORF Transcript_38997/g.107373 Transcript_38997/m.107373 type:complete len:218 (+) Transcript_38997:25-678(+)